VIRFVSEKNLVDDPLRILRAFRFSSVLGFEICEESVELIEKQKDKIYLPAVERRNVEIVKLFGGKYAHNVLLQMDKIGLVEKLFPDMKFVKKVPPNTHHHLDLFHHSLETVRQIQLIYENSNEFVKSHLESIDFGGDSRLAHLKFAGFLHDIGKFSTWTIEGERHRFIKHDEVGSEMSKKTLRVSKFSKKQIDYISFIIRNHIYPSSVISSPNLSEKVYMRYVRKAGDNAVDLIVVAMADRLSARGKAITDEMVAQNISGLEKLLQFYIDVKPTLRELPKLLSGDEIMDIKKIKPSAELGRIIKQLHEAQLDGDILTKQQAIDFVMKI
jgi:tRNA nucleotidyltransferase/poly(A) polymerase